jgi:hypothetical protein
MGSVDIALLATKTLALSTSWSVNVTIPSGKEPASLLVIMFADYGDEFTTYGATCTIAGASASQIYDVYSGYSQTRVWHKSGLTPGTKSVVVSNLRGAHENGGFVVGVYNTIGYVTANDISRADPPASYTVSPSIQAGHIWIEIPCSTGKAEGSAPNPASAQTSLVLNNNRRVQYKKDVGIGTKSFTTNFVDGVSDVYIGMEFLPCGRIFDIPPLAIG